MSLGPSTLSSGKVRLSWIAANSASVMPSTSVIDLARLPLKGMNAIDRPAGSTAAGILLYPNGTLLHPPRAGSSRHASMILLNVPPPVTLPQCTRQGPL